MSLLALRMPCFCSGISTSGSPPPPPDLHRHPAKKTDRLLSIRVSLLGDIKAGVCCLLPSLGIKESGCRLVLRNCPHPQEAGRPYPTSAMRALSPPFRPSAMPCASEVGLALFRATHPLLLSGHSANGSWNILSSSRTIEAKVKGHSGQRRTKCFLGKASPNECFPEVPLLCALRVMSLLGTLSNSCFSEQLISPQEVTVPKLKFPRNFSIFALPCFQLLTQGEARKVHFSQSWEGHVNFLPAENPLKGEAGSS